MQLLLLRRPAHAARGGRSPIHVGLRGGAVPELAASFADLVGVDRARRRAWTDAGHTSRCGGLHLLAGEASRDLGAALEALPRCSRWGRGRPHGVLPVVDHHPAEHPVDASPGDRGERFEGRLEVTAHVVTGQEMQAAAPRCVTGRCPSTPDAGRGRPRRGRQSWLRARAPRRSSGRRGSEIDLAGRVGPVRRRQGRERGASETHRGDRQGRGELGDPAGDPGLTGPDPTPVPEGQIGHLVVHQ